MFNARLFDPLLTREVEAVYASTVTRKGAQIELWYEVVLASLHGWFAEPAISGVGSLGVDLYGL